MSHFLWTNQIVVIKCPITLSHDDRPLFNLFTTAVLLNLIFSMTWSAVYCCVLGEKSLEEINALVHPPASSPPSGVSNCLVGLGGPSPLPLYTRTLKEYRLKGCRPGSMPRLWLPLKLRMCFSMWCGLCLCCFQ